MRGVAAAVLAGIGAGGLVVVRVYAVVLRRTSRWAPDSARRQNAHPVRMGEIPGRSAVMTARAAPLGVLYCPAPGPAGMLKAPVERSKCPSMRLR